jgi:hypothetical protein
VRFVTALVVVAVAVLPACGSNSNGDLREASDSGVRGVVVAGPQCPVEVQGSPCPDQPVPDAAIEVRRTDSGELVAEGHADGDGRFRFALPPGTYTMTVTDLGSNGGPPTAKPTDVEVREHEYVRADLIVDTGIR